MFYRGIELQPAAMLSTFALASISFSILTAQPGPSPQGVLQQEEAFLVTAIAAPPNGAVIASGGINGSILLWNTIKGKLIRSFVGHRAFVGALAFTPNGKELLSGSSDRTARLWDVETG